MTRNAMRPQILDCWTDRTRMVVRLAEQEARRLGDAYVGTEHLLLSILLEGGVAAIVIRQIAGDLSLITGEFQRLLIHEGDKPPAGPLPFTPRARRALENAHEEARHLGHRYVGTEHVLLSFLSESDGIVPTFFECRGLDRVSFRAQILMTLGLDSATRGREVITSPALASLNPDEPPLECGPHATVELKRSPRSHDMLVILITAILAALLILVGVPLLWSWR